MTLTLNPFTSQANRYWPTRLVLLFLGALLFSPLPVAAQDSGDSGFRALATAPILVAGSANTAFNEHFMKLLSRKLGDSADIRIYTEDRSLARPDALVITLGSSALSQIQQQGPKPPTLALMISEAQFSGYRDRPGADTSAIYNDLPLLQQALLGQLILPQATHIAVLARPGTEANYDSLAEALAQFNLELRVFTVDSNDALIPTLSRALSFGDFLLAASDEMIFNPRTIKHILLTTYRRNRIVIGPNRAFVGAGALASTYIPLPVIVFGAAAQIAAYRATGSLLPPDYPPDFAVEINDQVARSLNIPVPDPDILEARLKERLSELSKGVSQ